MTILESVANWFGFVKAPVSNPPAWLRATGAARRWDVPPLSLPEAQQDLYRRLSWVAIAVSAVSRSASLAPLRVQRLSAEETDEVINHPFEILLSRPNPLQSRQELLESTFSFRALTGNAYWWLNKTSEAAEPSEIWVLPPNQVQPVPDGKMYLRGYLYDPGDGSQIPLEPWEVCHFRQFHPLNSFVGLSPVEALSTVASGDLAMQKWNTNFFAKNNAKVPGALAFADPIDNVRWEQMKTEIEENHGGAERNLMLLRGTGQNAVQWVSMALSQSDMEFLQARQFNKEEIFATFAPGLASTIAINATEANAMAGRSTFMEMAVWPHMVSVAEKITNDILPSYGDKFICQFDDVRVTDRVLELQEQAAFERVSTIDEVRQRYYSLDGIGDERGALLVAEVGQSSAGMEPAFVLDGPMMADDESPLALPSVSSTAAKQEEIAVFRRWAKKRNNPNPADFVSDVLSDVEKLTLLREDGVAIDAPFPAGWDSYP